MRPIRFVKQSLRVIVMAIGSPLFVGRVVPRGVHYTGRSESTFIQLKHHKYDIHVPTH